MMEQMVKDRKGAKEGEDHLAMPAHVYAYQGLIDGLAKDLEGKAGCEGVATELKTVIEKWKSASPEQALAEVKICRVAKAFKKGDRKVLLSIGGSEAVVYKALLAAGAVRKAGLPPRTNLERIVQKAMEGVEAEEDDDEI